MDSGFTHEQLVALKEAIASGELVVQYNGRRIQYRSLDEMIKAKNIIEDELLSNGNRRRHRAIFNKGL